MYNKLSFKERLSLVSAVSIFVTSTSSRLVSQKFLILPLKQFTLILVLLIVLLILLVLLHFSLWRHSVGTISLNDGQGHCTCRHTHERMRANVHTAKQLHTQNLTWLRVCYC